MQEVSDTYKLIRASQAYHVETCVVIGATDVETANPDNGYGEDDIISIKTSRRAFKENVPTVGCCVCGEIYLEMHSPDTTIPRQASIMPFVRLVSDEQENLVSEWIHKGVFFIDTRENSNNDDGLNILSIHGYDSLIKANVEYGEFYIEEEFTISTWVKASDISYTASVQCNKSYNKEVSVEYIGDESISFSSHVTYSHETNSTIVRFVANEAPPQNIFGKFILRDTASNTLEFPAKDIDVVNDIASKIGVTVDSETIGFMKTQSSSGYMVEYPSEYTMIETLGYIGSMYGGNWVMNDIGQLKLLPLWGLPQETNLITDEVGYRLVFGTDPVDGKVIRIKYEP